LNIQCLPSTLYTALLPYQKEGVKFGLRQKGKVFIADEMGLGKTLQVFCFSSTLSHFEKFRFPLIFFFEFQNVTFDI